MVRVVAEATMKLDKPPTVKMEDQTSELLKQETAALAKSKLPSSSTKMNNSCTRLQAPSMRLLFKLSEKRKTISSWLYSVKERPVIRWLVRLLRLLLG